MSARRRKKDDDKGFDFTAFEKQLHDHILSSGGASGVGGHDFVKELVARTYQALLDAELEPSFRGL